MNTFVEKIPVVEESAVPYLVTRSTGSLTSPTVSLLVGKQELTRSFANEAGCKTEAGFFAIVRSIARIRLNWMTRCE